jgi:hypothetical protein
MRVPTIMAIAAAAMSILTVAGGQARASDGEWDAPAAAAALLAQAHQYAPGTILPYFFGRGSVWTYDRPGFAACYLLQVSGPDGARFVRVCP